MPPKLTTVYLFLVIQRTNLLIYTSNVCSVRNARHEPCCALLGRSRPPPCVTRRRSRRTHRPASMTYKDAFVSIYGGRC
jgi:hypothetical protein